MDEELDYNYCYHGLPEPWMVGANVILYFGLPIGGTILCGVSSGAASAGTLATIGGPVCGALGGVVGSLTYAWLSTYHQWPNHN